MERPHSTAKEEIGRRRQPKREKKEAKETKARMERKEKRDRKEGAKEPKEEARAHQRQGASHVEDHIGRASAPQEAERG